MLKFSMVAVFFLASACGQSFDSDVLNELHTAVPNTLDRCNNALAKALTNTSPFTVDCVSAQLSRAGKLLFSLSHHEFSERKILLGGKSLSVSWYAEERPQLKKRYGFLGDGLSMGGIALTPDSIRDRPGMLVESDHYSSEAYVAFHQIPEVVGGVLEVEFALPMVDTKTEKSAGKISGRIALTVE